MAAQTCKAGCGRPKKKGKHFCEWHWLARQSSDVQAAAARARLTAWVAEFADIRRLRVPPDEWPPGERWCSGCQSFVPMFYIAGTKGSQCRACKSMKAHEKRLEQTYGIDGAEYERIFDAQGRRCAICRNRPASIRFAVDHDHQTDDVRGILCKRCNHDLLGGAHDSIDMLWRAIAYLLAPPAQGPAPSTEALLVRLHDHLLTQRERARASRPAPEPPPF